MSCVVDIANRLPTIQRRILHKGGFVLVDEYFEIDLQFFAVGKQVSVSTWNARCTGIEVHVRLVIEFTILAVANFID